MHGTKKVHSPATSWCEFQHLKCMPGSFGRMMEVVKQCWKTAQALQESPEVLHYRVLMVAWLLFQQQVQFAPMRRS